VGSVSPKMWTGGPVSPTLDLLNPKSVVLDSVPSFKSLSEQRFSFYHANVHAHTYTTHAHVTK